MVRRQRWCVVDSRDLDRRWSSTTGAASATDATTPTSATEAATRLDLRVIAEVPLRAVHARFRRRRHLTNPVPHFVRHRDSDRGPALRFVLHEVIDDRAVGRIGRDELLCPGEALRIRQVPGDTRAHAEDMQVGREHVVAHLLERPYVVHD